MTTPDLTPEGIELLSCPFCGEVLIVANGKHAVHGPFSECLLRHLAINLANASQVAAWNTRATPAPTDNAALVRAVECERRHKSAYDALPQDCGGANGPKGKAYQLWMDARADVGNALTSHPAEATSRERVEENAVDHLRALLDDMKGRNLNGSRAYADASQFVRKLTPKASDEEDKQ